MKPSTKDTWLSILRTILTFAGTYAIGHNVFGHEVDSQTWEIIAGSVLAIGSITWGIIDKSAGVEQVESALRSILVSLGGVAVSFGLIKGELLVTILALLTPIITLIQSYASKVKVVQIDKGKVSTSETGKVTKNAA